MYVLLILLYILHTIYLVQILKRSEHEILATFTSDIYLCYIIFGFLTRIYLTYWYFLCLNIVYIYTYIKVLLWRKHSFHDWKLNKIMTNINLKNNMKTKMTRESQIINMSQHCHYLYTAPYKTDFFIQYNSLAVASWRTGAH